MVEEIIEVLLTEELPTELLNVLDDNVGVAVDVVLDEGAELLLKDELTIVEDEIDLLIGPDIVALSEEDKNVVVLDTEEDVELFVTHVILNEEVKAVLEVEDGTALEIEDISLELMVLDKSLDGKDRLVKLCVADESVDELLEACVLD